MHFFRRIRPPRESRGIRRIVLFCRSCRASKRKNLDYIIDRTFALSHWHDVVEAHTHIKVGTVYPLSERLLNQHRLARQNVEIMLWGEGHHHQKNRSNRLSLIFHCRNLTAPSRLYLLLSLLVTVDDQFYALQLPISLFQVNPHHDEQLIIGRYGAPMRFLQTVTP